MSINEILNNIGMTKYRLAKLSGVPNATLSELRSGKTSIEKCSGETLYKIAKILNVSIESLLEERMTNLSRERSYEYGLHAYLQHDLDALKGRIELDARTAEKLEEYKDIPLIQYEPKGERCFYCVDIVRHTGVSKGERNFWLGRLVNWHKSQGHNYEYTKSDVLRWNEKCGPHEVENILLDNFNRYWSEDYRLLGCVNSITDIKDRQSLANVCDRAKCMNNGNMPDDITVDCIKISKALLSKQRVRKMTGYHYLLLTLIYKYQYDYGSTGFTVRNLKEKLKENMRKCLCMSDDTIITG